MVLPPLLVERLREVREAAEREVVVEVRPQRGLDVVVLPVARVARLDLRKHAQAVDRPRLELLDRHVIYRRSVVAEKCQRV
jgi:hypothetical protein